MLYQMYEWQRQSMAPLRLLADHALGVLDAPGNPLRATPMGMLVAAGLNSFEHATRSFAKPVFGLDRTTIDGEEVEVCEEVVAHRTWCDLKRFRRAVERPNDPRLLIVAPMSGHHATLLRGTVEAFLPDHDVFITDWRNARDVSVLEENFDLDDAIEHVIAFTQLIGPGTHVVAVCQPAVPVLAAASLMNAEDDLLAPATITLIGGPIDTREAPTAVNEMAKRHDIEWFRRHVIHPAPLGTAGFMRPVYPGFLQLAGFLSMNMDRHVEAHWAMFQHLVEGDGESLGSKRAFYDEYMSVMDLSAEFYLQTIETVFHEHSLPRGTMVSRGRRVDPGAITRTALLTIEGERDDISGLGQTRAAHLLCHGLPESMREHREQAGVGHYGLFNGRRFRETIAPAIKAFVAAHPG